MCEKIFVLEPAQLPCLLVRRCPREAEEFWKGDFARFVWARPRMEGAGHEPVLLRFFVSNAETCAGHCHDKNIATYFDSDLLSSDQIQQSHREALSAGHIVFDSRALQGWDRPVNYGWACHQGTRL